MKVFFVFLFISVSLQAHAINWKIFGPCSDTPVAQGEFSASLDQSVGAISVQIFDQNKIPYIGAAEGFNSILNTPIGLDSIEVVSDVELRSYGWCYLVNGKMPTEMPHQQKFSAESDKLTWFYAYSTNRYNKWEDDYCSPAYWIKAKQFCDK